MQPPRKSKNELILGLVSISDRASKGIYDDRGIPELEAWCRKAITNPLTVHKRLIADERFDIEKTLRELVDIIGCDLKRLFSFRLEEGSLKELGDAAETYLLTQLGRGFFTLDFYKSLLIT